MAKNVFETQKIIIYAFYELKKCIKVYKRMFKI